MRGRRYTPPPPPPPRGHDGRRGPSPSPRGGGRYRDLSATLFVRNLSHYCRQKDLRRSFEQFGPLKDINFPRDYYRGYPRGFGFVEFEDRDNAAEEKYQMDGNLLLGRELSVVFAENNRKTQTEMRARQRGHGRSIRSRYYSRSPRSSRSPPPPRRSGDHYSLLPLDVVEVKLGLLFKFEDEYKSSTSHSAYFMLYRLKLASFSEFI